MANENKMKYVILGLLSHTPMTGYEMKKIMDTTMNLFWSGSYGSIYPTLQRLKEEESVSKVDSLDESMHRHEIQTGGRDKNIYVITEQGRDILREWLKEPAVKDEIRYETLLKVFFGSEVEENDILSHIHRFEHKMQETLPKLRSSVEYLKGDDSEAAHEYYMLTAMFGVKMYEASLAWCEDVKKYFIDKEEKEGK